MRTSHRVFPDAVCRREGQRGGKQSAARAAMLTSTGLCSAVMMEGSDGSELRKE